MVVAPAAAPTTTPENQHRRPGPGEGHEQTADQQGVAGGGQGGQAPSADGTQQQEPPGHLADAQAAKDRSRLGDARTLGDEEALSVSGMKSRVQRGRRRFAALVRTCCEITTDSRGELVDSRPLSVTCEEPAMPRYRPAKTATPPSTC